MTLPSYLRDNSEIKKITNCLKRHPVLKAYLFGSMARNETTGTSDIDLLVTVASGVSLFDFIRIQQSLETELERTIDLVSDEGLSSHIAPYINQDNPVSAMNNGGSRCPHLFRRIEQAI